jgi:capsular polysaccharide biosynthesis protein
MSSLQFVEGQPASLARPRPRDTFRWGLLLVLPVVLCAAVAFMFASGMPKIYAARAEVVFQPLGEGDISEAYKATQTVILTGRTILGPTSQTLQITYDDLAAAFTVGFPKGGSVMQLQVSDRDPRAAVNMLNLILDRYLAMLGRLDEADQAIHQLLVPPFQVENAIQPQPLQALMIGMIVGLAISMSAFALDRRSRAER